MVIRFYNSGVEECLREGVSFVGSPTARYEEVTETSECYTKCATRAGCVAFSLYKDTGSCMLKNAWLNPEPVTNHDAKDVVSASMDCILDAVGKVDKVIYSKFYFNIASYSIMYICLLSKSRDYI